MYKYATGFKTSDDNIRDRLTSYGMSTFEVDMIMDRVIYNLSFNEIVQKYGWTSTGSANHHFKSALKKLRKANFKI